MMVFENVVFGFEMRKFFRDEIKKKVEWVFELVGFKGFENCYLE